MKRNNRRAEALRPFVSRTAEHAQHKRNTLAHGNKADSSRKNHRQQAHDLIQNTADHGRSDNTAENSSRCCDKQLPSKIYTSWPGSYLEKNTKKTISKIKEDHDSKERKKA